VIWSEVHPNRRLFMAIYRSDAALTDSPSLVACAPIAAAALVIFRLLVAGSSFLSASKVRALAVVVFHHLVGVSAPSSLLLSQPPFAALIRMGPTSGIDRNAARYP